MVTVNHTCTQTEKISDLHIKSAITQESLNRMEQDLEEVKNDLKDVKNEITGVKGEVSSLRTELKIIGEGKIRGKEIYIIAVIIAIVVRAADPKLAEVVLSFFK